MFLNEKTKVKYVGPAVSRVVNLADSSGSLNSKAGLIFHPMNDTIRRCRTGSALDERQALKESIIKEGLNEAIKTFANSKYVVGGNTRLETLIELECTIIPVQEIPRTPALLEAYGEDGEIDPKHPDVMSKLRSDNTRVNVPEIDRYLAAQEGIRSEIAYSKTDTITEMRKKEIMRESNIAVKTFYMIQGLEQGYYLKSGPHKGLFVEPRPDLFEELTEYAEGKTIVGQQRSQEHDFLEMYDPSRKVYESTEEIDSLLEQFDWTDLCNRVKHEIASLKQRPWFDNCNEKNYKGATIHHIIAQYFPEVWNKLETNIKAVPVDNQSRYDIHLMVDNKIVNTIEIKTTMGTTWSTVSKKYGYILLYKFSEEMDRASIITSWLDKTWRNHKGKELWKAAGKGAVLDAKDLYDYGNYVIRLGDMYIENNKLKVTTTEL